MAQNLTVGSGDSEVLEATEVDGEDARCAHVGEAKGTRDAHHFFAEVVQDVNEEGACLTATLARAAVGV